MATKPTPTVSPARKLFGEPLPQREAEERHDDGHHDRSAEIEDVVDGRVERAHRDVLSLMPIALCGDRRGEDGAQRVRVGSGDESGAERGVLKRLDEQRELRGRLLLRRERRHHDQRDLELRRRGAHLAECHRASERRDGQRGGRDVLRLRVRKSDGRPPRRASPWENASREQPPRPRTRPSRGRRDAALARARGRPPPRRARRGERGTPRRRRARGERTPRGEESVRRAYSRHFSSASAVVAFMAHE